LYSLRSIVGSVLACDIRFNLPDTGAGFALDRIRDRLTFQRKITGINSHVTADLTSHLKLAGSVTPRTIDFSIAFLA
jgi:hypothetical protein